MTSLSSNFQNTPEKFVDPSVAFNNNISVPSGFPMTTLQVINQKLTEDNYKYRRAQSYILLVFLSLMSNLLK